VMAFRSRKGTNGTIAGCTLRGLGMNGITINGGHIIA
jgi:hypothetical protein